MDHSVSPHDRAVENQEHAEQAVSKYQRSSNARFRDRLIELLAHAGTREDVIGRAIEMLPLYDVAKRRMVLETVFDEAVSRGVELSNSVARHQAEMILAMQESRRAPAPVDFAAKAGVL